MMQPTSRYAGSATKQKTLPDGRVVTYLKRRFLPRGDALPVLVEITTSEGQRLDHIAAQTLGDPEQAWQISDANDAMNPRALTARPGRTLRIPLPQPPNA